MNLDSDAADRDRGLVARQKWVEVFDAGAVELMIGGRDAKKPLRVKVQIGREAVRLKVLRAQKRRAGFRWEISATAIRSRLRTAKARS